MGIRDLIKDYCENSTIHGIRYLTEKKRHWIERVFWLGAVSASAYGMYVLALASWNAFQTHAVSFVTDTNYLSHGMSSRKSFMYLREILEKPDDCNACVSCSTTLKSSCPENYRDIVREIFSNCSAMFDRCSWNGVDFSCCDNFFPLVTEVGPCFTINSRINRPQDTSKLVKMISNHQTGPGALVLHLYSPVEVYLHASEEVPYRNHPSDDKIVVRDMGYMTEHRFKVKEIKNDPLLHRLAVEPRGCRFGEEALPDSLHEYYSYSICVVECRMMAMIELCNCTHFYVPSRENVSECDAKGLACIYRHHKLLITVRRPWEDIVGLVCNCTLPCSDLEINNVWSGKHSSEETTGKNEIRIIMDSLPNERYQRNVIRTKLDLVVSLGGTAGLFLGASILSGVELIIYIFMRSIPVRKPPQQQQQQQQQERPKSSAVRPPDGKQRKTNPSFNRRILPRKGFNNAQPRRQIVHNIDVMY